MRAPLQIVPTERPWWKKSVWCTLRFHKWRREFPWSRERCVRCGRWAERRWPDRWFPY